MNQASETRRAGSDAEDRRPGSLRPLSLVWHALARYPGRALVALAALLVTSALSSVALPVALKGVIDHGFGADGDASAIDRWFRLLLGIVAVLGVVTAVRTYLVSWLGERVVADVRRAVYSNLMLLSPGFFEVNSPREISSRLTADTAVVERVVGSTLSVALRNSVTVALSVGYLFWLAPGLAVWLLAGIPVIVVPIAIMGRRISRTSRDGQDRIADIGAMTTEVLSGMKVVQSFGQQRREALRFSDAAEKAFVASLARSRIAAVLVGSMLFLMFGGVTLLLWRGAVLVAAGQLSGGTIGAFVFAGVVAVASFGALTDVAAEFFRAAGAAARLGELMAERPQVATPAVPRRLRSPPLGSIRFSDVSFRYPGRPEAPALEGFSLAVSPGETVAIVGPSGAGKSTVFQLVERFYDPDAGSIEVDGVPLVSADPDEVRSRMAYVPQDGVLFSADARDNLRYGAWDATDEAIWSAARDANAEGFLRALPLQLGTHLGEGGSQLSGGQRQRVAIARALLRDAPILLLDEATSALDAESERQVQEALERLMEGRTTMVIAHRLSTVRRADRIVVMDAGRIVEEGTHETLCAAGGLYARLAGSGFGDRD